MKYYVVDAFTDNIFHGNPAGVCVLEGSDWPEDRLLIQIAAENSLPETAFLKKQEHGYQLRYFSPVYEVPLCGHATMASSFVVHHFLEPDAAQILFETKSGPLHIIPEPEGYRMDLPARQVHRVPNDPVMEKAIGCPVLESYRWENDVFAVVESPDYVQGMTMDFSILNTIPGLFNCCVTAKGTNGFDFVSRLFSPNYVIPEDPVCGSAHCALTTLWAGKTEKTDFLAHQVSLRGGVLRCRLRQDRVWITGTAALYMRGEILI